jgi:hypothetical protein
MDIVELTHIIVVLTLFVLHKEFQALLTDCWLDMPTTTVTLFWRFLGRAILIIFPRFIRFAD